MANLVGAEDAKPSLPSNACDLAPILKGKDAGADAIFYEQEETRAIRTQEWLYALRFQGSETYPMQDELYRLTDDPLEKDNLIGEQGTAEITSNLHSQISAFFDTYSDPRYDLWRGGSAKSNVTFQNLWKDAWGDGWQPEHSV